MLSLFPFIAVSTFNYKFLSFQYLTVISVCFYFVSNGTLLSEGQKWNARKAVGVRVIFIMSLIRKKTT